MHMAIVFKRACRVMFVLLLACGCTLAPKYERPSPVVSEDWNGGGDVSSQPGTQALDWRRIVADESMSRLIELALENNRELRVAVLRIERARAQYGITRADQFPHIDAEAKSDMARTPESFSSTGDAYTSHEYSVGVGISSFELDLFGRVRSLKERALETYLSTDAAARSVQLSLVAEVGQAYMTLAANRELLALSQEIFETEQASYKMVSERYEHGVATELDVARARISVETARLDVAQYSGRAIEAENALVLLLGMPLVSGLAPAQALAEIQPLAEVPVGLPSEVLTRRPDVVSAEHALKAANANIGAARAKYFPRIDLTASLGSASVDMDELFRSGARTWTFVPRATLPLFHAGAIRAGVESAVVDRDICVAQYEDAVQTAFREVSDALARGSALTAQVRAQSSLVKTTGREYALASRRYENGLDSSLDKLDAQRSYATSRQNLIGLSLAARANRLTLFKVLGGGWSG